jgi:hypothetical protein
MRSSYQCLAVSCMHIPLHLGASNNSAPVMARMHYGPCTYVAASQITPLCLCTIFGRLCMSPLHSRIFGSQSTRKCMISPNGRINTLVGSTSCSTWQAKMPRTSFMHFTPHMERASKRSRRSNACHTWRTWPIDQKLPLNRYCSRRYARILL